MVAAALTPSPARAAAFCGSISKAVTTCPAFATKDAMGAPMAPRPIHPTLVISAVSFCEWWIERVGRNLSASGEEVDDLCEAVVVTDVAGEHDVRDTDGFGCRLDGAEDRHHAREQLADDLVAPDAEATDRDIVGGDAAFGDDPCRMRGECGLDHLDDRGGDGAGDGQAVVGVAAAEQGAAGEQQHIGGGEGLGDLPADGGNMIVASFGVQQGGHVQFGFGEPAAFLRLGDLPAGQADMGTDDNEPMPARTTGGPDLRRGERTLRFEPGERTGERRTTPVSERLALLLRLQNAQYDDLQVGVIGRIDHDEGAAGDPAQDLGDPSGPAEPDVVQGDAVHLVAGDGAAALLGDEVQQVGRGVTERRVLGELRVARWDGPPGNVGPVDVTGGETARLEEARDQQHPVEPGAGHATPGGVDRSDLGDDVAAQRGITAADDFHWGAEALAEGEQASGYPAV